LRHLWIGMPLDSRQFVITNNHLKKIYCAFFIHLAKQGRNDLVTPKQLRFFISQQILYCARSSNLLETLWLKLKILPYVLAWQPVAVFDYWLKVFLKVLGRRQRFIRLTA